MFEQPVDLDAMQALEKMAQGCMKLHGVTFQHSYVAPDRRRMICIYLAPDAEAVRTANNTAKLPYDRVWSASIFKPA
jgi:hypothetical protein